MLDEAPIREKYRALAWRLDEHTRRIWAATEASAIGYGGISLVARATDISRRAILVGLCEIKAGNILPEGRVRRPGGGRKSGVHHQPDLPKRLEGLVEPLTRGDPESPLRWTCKSTRHLSQELAKLGYSAGSHLVGGLLHAMGYSIQGNRKTVEGSRHPDRNAQFEHINAHVRAEMGVSQPIISVDTKKKGLVGNYANRGKQWLKKGEALSDLNIPRPAGNQVAQVVKPTNDGAEAIGTPPALRTRSMSVVPTPFADLGLGQVLHANNALGLIRNVPSRPGHGDILS